MPALVAQALDRLPVDAGVDRHEVRAEFCLLGRDPEEVVLFHVDDGAILFDCLDECLVERDTSHREGGVRDDLSPDLGKVPTGREFHEGIGTGSFGLFCLLNFLGNIDDIGGGPDRGIHLGAEPLADTADLYFPVGRDRDNDVAFGNAAPDEVFGDSFLCRDLFHLFCDDAALGICDNTHTLPVRRKGQIKTRFCNSGLKSGLLWKQVKLSLGKSGKVCRVVCSPF